jgi:hypothetical protein
MRSPLIIAAVVASVLAVTPAASAAALSAAAPTSTVAATVPLAGPKLVSYKNCTALKKVHPSGVAKAGVKYNKVNGKNKPLKGKPTFSTALYKKNTALDRDKDGIACEKS